MLPFRKKRYTFFSSLSESCFDPSSQQSQGNGGINYFVKTFSVSNRIVYNNQPMQQYIHRLLLDLVPRCLPKAPHHFPLYAKYRSVLFMKGNLNHIHRGRKTAKRHRIRSARFQIIIYVHQHIENAFWQEGVTSEWA